MLQNKAQSSSLALQPGKLSAVLLLNGSPGICQVQQWEEKRESAGTVGIKNRLQVLDAPYLPCCWLVCWHVPPSAASTSLIPARYLHGSFLGTKGDRTELPCFGQEKRQGEGLQDFPYWGLGTPVWLTAPNSPTGNVRTWAVRGPTTDCV